MRTLTLYGRADCHLCDAMAQSLLRLRASLAFGLEIVDIDGDPELEERLGDKIPTLFDGKVEICRYFLNEEALREHLQSA